MRDERESLFDHVPRIRLTFRDPFKEAWIGPTIWVGSKARGWVGKPLNARKWYLTWRFTPTRDT